MFELSHSQFNYMIIFTLSENVGTMFIRKLIEIDFHVYSYEDLYRNIKNSDMYFGIFDIVMYCA